MNLRHSSRGSNPSHLLDTVSHKTTVKINLKEGGVLTILSVDSSGIRGILCQKY